MAFPVPWGFLKLTVLVIFSKLCGMSKRCNTCGEVKDEGGFYADPRNWDGLKHRCKECLKPIEREKSRAGRERSRELYRERVSTAEGREMERKKRRDTYARQRLDERFRQRVRARALVGKAIREGRLVRGPCEVVGCTERATAHHEDYSRPLEVRWLCRVHHGMEHRQYA